MAPQPLVFEQAVIHCQELGGNMLFIETEDELAAVKTILNNFNGQQAESFRYFMIGNISISI